MHQHTCAEPGEHRHGNTAAPWQDEAKADLSSVETSAVGRHQEVCKVQHTVVRSLAELVTESKLCQSVSQEAFLAISSYVIARVRMHVCRHVNTRAELCPGSSGLVVLFILFQMKC